MNAKDKKKKRKKKKKRIPIVIAEIESKPKSRTSSNKPASVGKKEFVTNGSADDTRQMAQGDEKPPPKVRVLITNSYVDLTILLCSHMTKERAKPDRTLQPRKSLFLHLTLEQQ
jgi:hypothetical protein